MALFSLYVDKASLRTSALIHAFIHSFITVGVTIFFSGIFKWEKANTEDSLYLV